MTTDPTAPSAEAIEAAGVAMEDAALTLLGRDLGTIHRNTIAHAAITAALPLLSVPEADEVEWLRAEIATLTKAAESALASGKSALESGERAVADGKAMLELAHKRGAERDEAVAQVERVRALADEWARVGEALTGERAESLLDVAGDLYRVLAARTPDDDAEGKSCTCGAIEYGALSQHLPPCPLAEGKS